MVPLVDVYNVQEILYRRTNKGSAFRWPPRTMIFGLPIYPTVPLIIAVLYVLYVRSIAKWRTRSRGRPFPPGPPALPLLGNMFNIPGDRAWLDFQELTAQYGESKGIDRVVDG